MTAAAKFFPVVVLVGAVLFALLWWMPQAARFCGDYAPIAVDRDYAPVIPSIHLQERVATDGARGEAIEAIRSGRCTPLVYECEGGKLYLICPDVAFGKAGIIPLYWSASRGYYVAATSYLAPNYEKILERDGCVPSPALWR